MSQPREITSEAKEQLAQPIRGMSDLIAIFIKKETAPELRRIGIEQERFAVGAESKLPIPFAGTRSISALFEALQAEGYSPIQESGKTIALSHDGCVISLEPGCQIEIALPPERDIAQIEHQLDAWNAQLERLGTSLGIQFIQMGFHPTARLEDVAWVPKKRYPIMRRYMPTKGQRGLDMMTRTCTIQANLDYVDEADMVLQARAGCYLSPILTALFANSPLYEGKSRSVLSERALVWQDVDPDRCGIPKVVFEAGFGYEKWIEWVLDVPMYFIRRGELYVDVAGASFRRFVQYGLMGYTATIQDFMDHLTTIFTEIRFKPYLELRSADCGPTKNALALAALSKGLFYNQKARDGFLNLFDGKFSGKSIETLAKETVALAGNGLADEEKKYLSGLKLV